MPSEYFLPDVERPHEIVGHDLDFTYLFDKDVENAAFEELGQGIRVQADSDISERVQKSKSDKIQRMVGVETRIADYPALKEILKEI